MNEEAKRWERKHFSSLSVWIRFTGLGLEGLAVPAGPITCVRIKAEKEEGEGTKIRARSRKIIELKQNEIVLRWQRDDQGSKCN